MVGTAFAGKGGIVVEMNLINQGRTAEVYDIGNNQILKLFREKIPLTAINQEYRIAETLKDCPAPSPKFFGKMECEGRTGLIYEYIRGQSQLMQIMRQPWRARSCAKDMADIHAAIHRIAVVGIPGQKEQLEWFIGKAEGLTEAQKSVIVARLKKLPDGKLLCHGDLHPDNILGSGKTAVVIDWMTATAGNPVGDVARTVVILKYSPVPPHLPWLARVMTNLLKSIICNTYLKTYLKLTGMDRRQVGEWELPIAAARLFENGPVQEKQALMAFILSEIKNMPV